MARRVILDAGVIIALERGTLDIDTVLGVDDAAIASITAMELLVGVERADEVGKQRRIPHVEAIMPVSSQTSTLHQQTIPLRS